MGFWHAKPEHILTKETCKNKFMQSPCGIQDLLKIPHTLTHFIIKCAVFGADAPEHVRGHCPWIAKELAEHPPRWILSEPQSLDHLSHCVTPNLKAGDKRQMVSYRIKYARHHHNHGWDYNSSHYATLPEIFHEANKLRVISVKGGGCMQPWPNWTIFSGQRAFCSPTSTVLQN